MEQMRLLSSSGRAEMPDPSSLSDSGEHQLFKPRLRSQRSVHSIGSIAVFIDGGGVGGGVVDNVRALHVHCFDIQFGGKPEAMGSPGVQKASDSPISERKSGVNEVLAEVRAIPYESDLMAQLVGLRIRIISRMKSSSRRRRK